MSAIPINSGTGPGVAVDLVGTDNYQVVKIMQASSGTTGSLGSTIAVSGTMTIANLPVITVGNTVTITGTVGALMLQRLDNTNDNILIYGAQTGSAVNTPFAVSTTGGLYIASGGGGGAQYGVGTTNAGATGTGTIILGIQSGSTALQAVLLSTAGGLFIASGGGGGAQYGQSTTGIAATGTGTLAMGMQGTTAWIIAITASGQQVVSVANTVAISGTVSSAFITTTASIAIIGTAHASRFQAFAISTTSAGAGVIVKTSGASTIYITDVLISVPSPMTVGLYSETTGPLANAYLAANGGFSMNLVQPLICTTAQSLRIIQSSSGSCSVSVIGYTVT